MNREGQCSVEGCEQKILAKRLCMLHYGRKRNGVPEKVAKRGSIPAEDRFWNFVDKTSSCWVWTGGKDKNGYGIFGSSRSTRFAWRLAYGSIPSHMFVCHRCDNPPCVRIEHLFLGTGKDNSDDMIRKGRWHNGCHKFSDAVIAEIRSKFTGAYGQVSRLSREYGIANSQMWEICHRKSRLLPQRELLARTNAVIK